MLDAISASDSSLPGSRPPRRGRGPDDGDVAPAEERVAGHGRLGLGHEAAVLLIRQRVRTLALLDLGAR
jgi:hypothetical protein